MCKVSKELTGWCTPYSYGLMSGRRRNEMRFWKPDETVSAARDHSTRKPFRLFLAPARVNNGDGYL